jgi:hypothetical protein
MRTMRSTPTNHGSRSNSDRGWRHRFRASIAPLAVAAGATVATHAADLPAPAGPAADAAAARKVIDEAARRAAAGGGPAAPVQAAPVQDGPAQVAPAGRVPDDILLAGVSAEVAAKQLEAKRLAQKSPGDAIALLDGTAAYVEAQPIPADKKEQFARRIERARRDIEEAAGKRRAELALERKAAEVEGRVERDRAQKVEVDQRIALLVDEYNTLVDQRRFAEAETVAKRAGQLAPDNIVVRQMLLQSKTIARIDRQGAIGAAQQDGVLDVLADVERAGTPFTGPIEFPVTKDWEQLTKSRQRLKAEGKGRATPAELAIHRKLDTKVTTDYRNQPLSAVLKSLQDQAGVNIHLDMVGLDLEKVGSDTPVTLALDQQITLRSVLKLLLEPLHLRYVVQDEVLKVTSPELVKGVVYPVTYQVGDLVKPIPNFSADGLGIEGALMKGYDMALRNQLQVSVEPPADALNRAARSSAGVPAGSLAQIQGRGGRGPVSGMPAAVPFGPPNVGGGGQADFQSLIDLITNTVGGPGVWADQGGNGQIRPLDISLSIVVLQTQEIHEQIADLLDQLRRLQDLQVTIEVRFISLNDTFFERIGVDFDFNIQTGVNEPLNMTAVPTQGGGSSSPGQYGINVAPGAARRSRPAGGSGRGPQSQRHREPAAGGGGRRGGPAVQPAEQQHLQLLLRPVPAGQLQRRPRAAVPRPAVGGRLGRVVRVRDPLRHRGLLPHRGRPGQHPVQRAPGAEGHAVQRPKRLRLRHAAAAVRDLGDAGRGRVRRRPAAGDHGSQRGHRRERRGGRLQRPAVRATDARPVLLADRPDRGVPVRGLEELAGQEQR